MRFTVENYIKVLRSYIGTPFGHQGRFPGKRLDCVGGPIQAAKEFGVELVDLKTYSRNPRTEDIIKGLYDSGFYDISESEVKAGDIGLAAYNGNVQHLATITSTDPMYIIHAVNGKYFMEHRNNLNFVRFLRYSKFEKEGEE